MKMIKVKGFLRALCASAASLFFVIPANAQQLVPVPLKDVTLTDGFWKSKLDVNRAVTVWHNFKMCEDTGRIANFSRAAGIEKGPHQGAFFNDSDVYKVIEGASYILAQQPDDKKLDDYLDKLIATIAKAQMPDGYLYTFYQLGDMSKKFTNLKDMHELYCGGHLIEAGVAHHQATGKTALLDAAIKFADLVNATFGPSKRHDVPGHEEIELALMKLSRETKQDKYRKLADFFVAQRGQAAGHTLYGAYHQDQKPLSESDELMGHAVRQMYFLCAATDVTACGDGDYTGSLDRLWDDLVQRKMYITGGVGARHDGEAFGAPYELPNETAYAETCAGIGAALWNQRMNLLTGDAKYADVVEQASFNGILSGVSVSGDKFFYVNPLASKGDHHRQSWYDCACCPTNIERYLASLPGRVYATAYDDASKTATVYVNTYSASEAAIALPDGKIKITQETDYPWSGSVLLHVEPSRDGRMLVKLRIPRWCEGATIKVDGRAVKDLKIDHGYATIENPWNGGETIELDLPMPIRRVHADPRVKDDVGKVALQRGPIVYCAEAADNGGHAMNLSLAPDAALKPARRDDLLGGVTIITGPSITAVPYYAWDNRTPGQMAVWLHEPGK